MVERWMRRGSDEVEGNEAFGCAGYVEHVGFSFGLGDAVWVFEVAGEGSGT